MRFATLSLLSALAAQPLWADEAQYARAEGNVVAALQISDACDGIGKLGQGDSQSYIMAATDLLGTQGYRLNKLRRALFYATTESLDALGAEALAARGVKAGDTSAMCKLGRKVAGKADAIGQFLVP